MSICVACLMCGEVNYQAKHRKYRSSVCDIMLSPRPGIVRALYAPTGTAVPILQRENPLYPAPALPQNVLGAVSDTFPAVVFTSCGAKTIAKVPELAVRACQIYQALM